MTSSTTRRHCHAVVLTLLALFTVANGEAAEEPHSDQPAQTFYKYRVVAEGLTVPWEITWGPDGYLWCSERSGQVSRIHPETGARDVVLDIADSVINFEEAGLLGMALHPDFPDSPYVYLTYVHPTPNDEFLYRQYYERYRYDGDTLTDMERLLVLPDVWSGHAGSRIKVAPDRTLIITTGDATRGDRAQELNSYNGKVLRMNLDGTIPADNPDPNSYIYAIGLRNPQGLAVTADGRIYTAEHGPDTDDEVNAIVAGGNYGWPIVTGPCDQDYELPWCDSLHVVHPVYTTGNRTYGLSALEYYTGTVFPEWNERLLVGSLKSARLQALRLADDGITLQQERQYLNHSVGRIRDFAFSPDGRVFLCTSNRDGRAGLGYPFEPDDRIYEVLRAEPGERPIIDRTMAADTFYLAIGDTVIRTITLGNTGPAILAYDSWSREGEAIDDIFEWRFDEGAWVSNTHNHPFPLQLRPTYDGTRTTYVNFLSSQLATVHKHAVVLTTRYPVIEAASDTLYVDGSVNTETLVDVTLHNTGNEPFVGVGSLLVGPAAQEYTVRTDITTLTIAANDSATMVVAFRPTTEGTGKTATLSLRGTYGPDIAPITIIGQALTTSVDEGAASTSHIVVHPTPARAGFTATIGNAIGTVHDVWLSDLGGRRVATPTMQQATPAGHRISFRVDGLGAGMYVLHLTTDRSAFTRLVTILP